MKKNLFDHCAHIYCIMGDAALGWLIAALAFLFAAIVARQSRSSMLEVIRSDYVTTARAKGQKEGKTISDHVLRNSMIPVIP